MNLQPNSEVLDIGSGLGGAARALAETYGCHVTGVDLTPAFCAAAEMLSGWLGLERVRGLRAGRRHRSAIRRRSLRCGDDHPRRDEHRRQARALRGGPPRAQAGSNLRGLRRLAGRRRRGPLPGALGARALDQPPAMPSRCARCSPMPASRFSMSTTRPRRARWFAQTIERMAQSGPPGVSFNAFLGDDFPEMARNQLRNVTERRIRTVTYICQADGAGTACQRPDATATPDSKPTFVSVTQCSPPRSRICHLATVHCRCAL